MKCMIALLWLHLAVFIFDITSYHAIISFDYVDNKIYSIANVKIV